MKSSQDSQKKEKPQENEQDELALKENSPSPIDSSALANKPSEAGGSLNGDIEAQKLEAAKRLEESNKKDVALNAATIEVQDGESARLKDNAALTPHRKDVGDRLEEERRVKQAEELFAGKGTFFTRDLSERERLIAVRDSYDKIAQLLPIQQAGPVKSEGRELLGLNASMEMAECIGRLTRKDSSETPAAKRTTEETATTALKEIQRLAKVDPPSETAALLVQRLGGAQEVDKTIQMLGATDAVTRTQAVRRIMEATRDGADWNSQNAFAGRVESARNQHLMAEMRVAVTPEDHAAIDRKLQAEAAHSKNISPAGQLQLKNLEFFNQTALTLKGGGNLLDELTSQSPANPHARAALAILSLGDPNGKHADVIKAALAAHEKEFGLKLPLAQGEPGTSSGKPLWQKLSEEEKEGLAFLGKSLLMESAGREPIQSRVASLVLAAHHDQAGAEKEKLAAALKNCAAAPALELPLIPGQAATRFDGKAAALEAVSTRQALKPEIEAIEPPAAESAVSEQRQLNTNTIELLVKEQGREVEVKGEGESGEAKHIKRVESSEGADYALRVVNSNGEISEYHYNRADKGSNQDSAKDTLVAVKSGGTMVSSLVPVIDFKTHLKKAPQATSDAWVVMQASGHKSGAVLYEKHSLDRGTGTETIEGIDGSKIVKRPDGVTVETRDGTTSTSLKLENGVTIEGDQSGAFRAMTFQDGTRIESLPGGRFRQLKTDTSGKLQEQGIFSGQLQLTAQGGQLQIVEERADGARIFRQDGAVMTFSKNGSELEIQRGGAQGRALKIGAFDEKGLPTKIYSEKEDGSYRSTEDGITWKSYDANGKLIAGSEKQETVLLDLAAGVIGHLSKDRTKVVEERFDGSLKQYEAVGKEGLVVTREVNAGGTEYQHSYKEGRLTESQETAKSGAMRTWQNLMLKGQDGQSLDYPVLTARRSAIEHGSQEMTFNYESKTKPGAIPKIVSYTDEQGKWLAKGGAPESGIYINEKSGEYRVESLAVTPDGRLKRVSQVQNDVIGLSNDLETSKEITNLDGTVIAFPASGGLLLRDKEGNAARTISDTGASRDYSYNEAGLLNKVVETDATGKTNTWEASMAHMLSTWRDSTGKVEHGDWRVSKTTGQEFFIFEKGASYSRDAGQDIYKQVSDGKEAREKVDDLMTAYEDWYLTNGRRFEALRSKLENMTPDQIMMFRRAFKEKHSDDYSTFGHYIGEKFGQSARGEILTEMINPRARTVSAREAEITAGKLRAVMHEMKEDSFFKRSEAALQREMRETIANLDQVKLNNLNKVYEARHHKSAGDDVKQLPGYEKAPAVHQKSMDLYLQKGADRRTVEEEKALLQESTRAFQFEALGDSSGEARQNIIATNNRIAMNNLELFKEFAGRSSQRAREEFKNEGGDKSLENALVPEYRRQADGKYKFENGIFSPLSDPGRLMTIARDYVREGKTSALTKIEENNWGTGPSQEQLEKIFQNMSEADRGRFRLGFELASDLKKDKGDPRHIAASTLLSETNHTDEAKRAKDAHNYFLEFAAKSRELHWFARDIKEAKYLQAAYGSQAGMELDKHAGIFTHGSAQNFMKSVENLDAATITSLVENPELHALLKAQVRNRYGDDERGERALALVERKLELVKDFQSGSDERLAVLAPALAKPENLEQFKAGRALAGHLESLGALEKQDYLKSLKATPEAQKQLQNLESFHRTVYEGTTNVRRDIREAIRDGSGVSDVMQAIERMTPAERTNYSQSREFRQGLAEALKETLPYSQAGQEAALSLLRQIGENPAESPRKDALTRLLEQAATKGPSVTEGMKIINESLSTESGEKLRERLKVDPQLRESFERAVNAVFQVAIPEGEGSTRYEVLPDLDTRIILPAINGGLVPVKEMNQYLSSNQVVENLLALGGGSPSNAITALSEKEKGDLTQRLSAKLSTDQNEIAQAVLKQGTALPEDKLRAFTLGIIKEDTALSIIKDIAAMPQDKRQTLLDAYAGKYDSDLLTDMKNRFSVKEAGRLEAALRNETWSDHRSYEHARQEASAVDTFGADYGFDSSRLSLEESSRDFATALTTAHKEHRALTSKEINQLQDKVFTSIEDHVRSQEQRADLIADTCIMAAAAAATVCTAGAASPLLLASFTAGAAAFKLGATATMTGSNFDSRASNVFGKLSSGAVNGFTGIFGPAELAAVAGIGSRAASRVAGNMLSDAAMQGLSTSAKKEIQETITREVAESMRQQILSGAYKPDGKMVGEVVGDLVKRGLLDESQAQVARRLMGASLKETMEAEAKAFLKHEATTMALNQVSGAGGSVLGAYTDAKIRGVEFTMADARDAILRGSLGAGSGHLGGRASLKLTGGINGGESLLALATKSGTNLGTLVGSTTSANFAAENMIASLRGTGYSGEGFSQQTLNAAIAPFFQQIRQSHNLLSNRPTENPQPTAHSEVESKPSTGHQVDYRSLADIQAQNLAKQEAEFKQNKAWFDKETLQAKEQDLQAARVTLTDTLVRDAGELIARSTGVSIAEGEALAREIGIDLKDASENPGAQGQFDPRSGRIDLYVGDQAMANKPGQTVDHETAHLLDAARNQALFEANPKLFLETLVDDCMAGAFSKGEARLEKAVFGERTFEREAVGGKKGFSQADADFAREQIKAFMIENMKDGKLPAVPSAEELNKFIYQRGADFPHAQFSHNQALIHEMRREISNLRVTFNNTGLAPEALGREPVRRLVDLTRKTLGENPSKERYVNALAGASDAALALGSQSNAYYDFGSRYENKANRLQYSRTLEGALGDSQGQTRQLQIQLHELTADGQLEWKLNSVQTARHIKDLATALDGAQASTVKMLENLNNPAGKAALAAIANEPSLPAALKETARQLSANMQVVEESTRALRFLTALDMVARDSAKLKMQDPAAPREELQASRKQWLESAFANAPQGEEARLAAYMVRRGYMDADAASLYSAGNMARSQHSKHLNLQELPEDNHSTHYSKLTPEELKDRAVEALKTNLVDPLTAKFLAEAMEQGIAGIDPEAVQLIATSISKGNLKAETAVKLVEFQRNHGDRDLWWAMEASMKEPQCDNIVRGLMDLNDKARSLLTPPLDTTIPAILGAGINAVHVNALLSGLEPNSHTTYRKDCMAVIELISKQDRVGVERINGITARFSESSLSKLLADGDGMSIWRKHLEEQNTGRSLTYTTEQLAQIADLPRNAKAAFGSGGFHMARTINQHNPAEGLSSGNIADILTHCESNPDMLRLYSRLDGATAERIIYGIENQSAQRALESILQTQGQSTQTKQVANLLLDNYGNDKITPETLHALKSAIDSGVVNLEQLIQIEAAVPSVRAAYLELIHGESRNGKAHLGHSEIGLLLEQGASPELIGLWSSAFSTKQFQSDFNQLSKGTVESLLKLQTEAQTQILDLARQTKLTENSLLLASRPENLEQITTGLRSHTLTTDQLNEIANLAQPKRDTWIGTILPEMLKNPGLIGKENISALLGMDLDSAKLLPCLNLAKQLGTQTMERLIASPSCLDRAIEIMDSGEIGQRVLRHLPQEGVPLSQENLNTLADILNEANRSHYNLATIYTLANRLRNDATTNQNAQPLSLLESLHTSLYLQEFSRRHASAEDGKRFIGEVKEIRRQLAGETITLGEAAELQKVFKTYRQDGLVENYRDARDLTRLARAIEQSVGGIPQQKALDLAFAFRESNLNHSQKRAILDFDQMDAANISITEGRRANRAIIESLEPTVNRLVEVAQLVPELTYRERQSVVDLVESLRDGDQLQIARQLALYSDGTDLSRGEITRAFLKNSNDETQKTFEFAATDGEIEAFSKYLLRKERVLTDAHFLQVAQEVSAKQQIEDPEVLIRVMDSVARHEKLSTEDKLKLTLSLHAVAKSHADPGGSLEVLNETTQRNFIKSWLNLLERTRLSAGEPVNSKDYVEQRFELLQRLNSDSVIGLNHEQLGLLVKSISKERINLHPEHSEQIIATLITGTKALEHSIHVSETKELQAKLAEYASPHVLDLLPKSQAEILYGRARDTITKDEGKLKVTKDGTIENLEKMASAIIAKAASADGLSSIIDKFPESDRAAAVKHLMERRHFTSSAALAEHFKTSVTSELELAGAIGKVGYTYGSKIKNISVLALTTEGRNLAYLFRKFTGIGVDVYGPNDKLPDTAKLVLFDAPEKLPPGSKLSAESLSDLISGESIVHKASITDYAKGINLDHLAAAEAGNPNAAIRRLENSLAIRSAAKQEATSKGNYQDLENYLNAPVEQARTNAVNRGMIHMSSMSPERRLMEARVLGSNHMSITNVRMAKQAQVLHEQVRATLELKPGQDLPEHVVFASYERDGKTSADSSMKAIALYRAANDLTDSKYDRHFLSMRELESRIKQAGREDKPLRVFTPNDLSATGTEAIAIYSKIKATASAAGVNDFDIKVMPFFTPKDALTKIEEAIGAGHILTGESGLSGLLAGRISRQFEKSAEVPVNSKTRDSMAKSFRARSFSTDEAGEPTMVVMEHMYPNTTSKPFTSLLRAMGHAGASEVRIGSKREQLTGIRNIGVVSEQIVRSGRPRTEDQIRQLAGLGVKHVINLNLEETNAGRAKQDIEKDWCANFGLTYESIPMSTKDVTVKQLRDVAEKLATMEKKGEKVLLHCEHGRDRTGICIAALRQKQGSTYTEALEEMKSYSFSHHTPGAGRTLDLLKELYGEPK